MLLTQPIHAHVAAAPNRVALSDGATQLTWSELRGRVQRSARRLLAAGIGHGDRVGVAIAPSIEWYETFVGLLYIGAIPNLIAPDIAQHEMDSRALEARLDHILRAPLDGNSPEVGDGTGSDLGVTFGLERPLYEVWTSGTTGAPKVVQISTRQALFSAWGAAGRLGFVPGDRWLLCLPTHHVGGASIVLRSLFVGYSVRLHHPFDAAAINALIDGDEVQHASLVPTMLRRLLDERGGRKFPATIRSIMLGGSATPAELIARAEALNAPISLTWGMSETGSHVATNEAGDTRPGAPLLPFMSVRTQPETGRLHVVGPLAPRPDFASPDLGEVVEGRVRILGRADRVFISGGENIDPARVEAALCSHPDVRASAVVAQASDEWGARPHLFYESDNDPGPAALRAYAADKLLAFEVPDTMTRLKALPQNSTGKVDFPALRALLPAEQCARSEDRAEP